MKSTRRPGFAALAGLALLGGCSARDASPEGSATSVPPNETPAVVAGAEPTAIDISNYKLDIDKMRRYAAAIKGFSALPPSDTAGMDALNLGSNTSTASIAALEAHPAASRVLSEAGLTARDYVWITSAYLQAAMTQGFLQASPEFEVPEGQSRQNVDFLNANKAALETMMKDAGMMQ